MDNNPVHTTKTMIDGQINGIFFSARVNPPQPNGTCFFVDKEIHKKAASGGGCSQTVAPLNRTSRTDDPNEPWCVVNTKLPVETALDSKPDFTFWLFHIKSVKFLF